MNTANADLITSVIACASLAACAGLRSFVPLAALLVVLQLHAIPSFELPPQIEVLRWMPVTGAVVALAALEILADKIQAISSLFDVVLMPLRPAGGILACFAVLRLPSLEANLFAAMAVALFVSLPMMKLKNGGQIRRNTKGAESRGLGLSLIEDLLAALGPVFALIQPIVALLLLVTVSFVLLSRNPLATQLNLADGAQNPAQRPGPPAGR